MPKHEQQLEHELTNFRYILHSAVHRFIRSCGLTYTYLWCTTTRGKLCLCLCTYLCVCASLCELAVLNFLFCFCFKHFRYPKYFCFDQWFRFISVTMKKKTKTHAHTLIHTYAIGETYICVYVCVRVCVRFSFFELYLNFFLCWMSISPFSPSI